MDLISVQIRNEIVATKDRTAEIGSKKLIKSQFEYDLDRILVCPRLDRISLMDTRIQPNWTNQLFDQDRGGFTACKILSTQFEKTIRKVNGSACEIFLNVAPF